MKPLDHDQLEREASRDESPFRSPEALASFLAKAHAYQQEQAAWWKGEMARIEEDARKFEALRIGKEWPKIQQDYLQGDYDKIGTYQSSNWGD